MQLVNEERSLVERPRRLSDRKVVPVTTKDKIIHETSIRTSKDVTLSQLDENELLHELAQSKNMRMFGSGNFPRSLFSDAMRHGEVFLASKRLPDDILPVEPLLNIRGKFEGSYETLLLPLGDRQPQTVNSFETARELGLRDQLYEKQIVATNAQDFRDKELLAEEGLQTPSNFVKHFTVYLANRFKWHSDGDSPIQITPLELTSGNGQKLYEAVIDALEDKDVLRELEADWVNVEEFQEFLITQCCWYDTIDDRITPDRQTGDEENRRNCYPEIIDTEPYATLHFSKAQVSKNAIRNHRKAAHLADLSPPFVGNGDNVLEVDDLTPYSDRKLGLLNAVHVFMVIQALSLKGVNHFAQIASMKEAEELLGTTTVYDWMKHKKEGKSLFDDINIAADIILGIVEEKHRGSGVEFTGFLNDTWDRFDNPFANHELIKIFESMDKFPGKIDDRIRPFIAEAKSDELKYDSEIDGGSFHVLEKFAAFC